MAAADAWIFKHKFKLHLPETPISDLTPDPERVRHFPIKLF